MRSFIRMNRWIPYIAFVIVIAVWGNSSVDVASAHGGKTHGGTGFSALQAVQKATQLYDRLITSGKLPEDWETALVAINVSDGTSGDKREYMVEFHRSAGDPGSVYFFFDLKGEYTGSNFTGK